MQHNYDALAQENLRLAARAPPPADPPAPAPAPASAAGANNTGETGSRRDLEAQVGALQAVVSSLEAQMAKQDRLVAVLQVCVGGWGWGWGSRPHTYRPPGRGCQPGPRTCVCS